MKYLHILILCWLSFFIMGCGDSDNYAPVTEIGTIESIPKTGMHRVKRGETLYAIAWAYGLDYRFVAQRNHIKPPYGIHTGEIIYLRNGPARQSSHIIRRPILFTKPIASRKTSPPVMLDSPRTPEVISRTEVTHAQFDSTWMLPAKGKIITGFSGFNKGINISGRIGEPIFATAAGKIVYCGNGLRGYGNLILIKHDNEYLSAYAHNRIIFVHEGEVVSKGQKIAEMGSSGSNTVMLHFEIRRAGVPINPLSVLNMS